MVLAVCDIGYIRKTTDMLVLAWLIFQRDYNEDRLTLKVIQFLASFKCVYIITWGIIKPLVTIVSS